MQYSVESVPCKPIVREYVDGGSLRQYIFLLSSREFYDAETLTNMNTAKFYDEFSAWMEEENIAGHFPQLPGVTATRTEPLTNGYFFDTEGHTARFQIQCRVLYKKSK